MSFKCLDEFCPDIKAPLEPVKSEPEPKAKPKAKLTRRSRRDSSLFHLIWRGLAFR